MNSPAIHRFQMSGDDEHDRVGLVDESTSLDRTLENNPWKVGLFSFCTVVDWMDLIAGKLLCCINLIITTS
jgi:hypothetical protein